jgi:hypothetical protein
MAAAAVIPVVGAPGAGTVAVVAVLVDVPAGTDPDEAPVDVAAGVGAPAVVVVVLEALAGGAVAVVAPATPPSGGLESAKMTPRLSTGTGRIHRVRRARMFCC